MLDQIHSELGITKEYINSRNVDPFEEARLEELEIVSLDFDGRPLVLKKEAAKAWHSMAAAAKGDGIELLPYSGFRSYMAQKKLIQFALGKGRDLNEVLTCIAVPGYSEHHTGRAVDISTIAISALIQSFEETKEFEWLTKNAKAHDFVMSFPEGNKYGYIYEPWHWCYRAGGSSV